MNGRIARVAGGVVVLLASLAAVELRAQADGGDKKVEKKRVVVHAPGGGRLGIGIADTEGTARGAAVKSVADDSAAKKAGLQEGDVIVRFDGETVRSASQLRRLVAETPSGRPVAIEVQRGDATQKLTATLAEGPQHFEGPRAFRFEGPHGLKEWTLHMPDFDVEAPEPPGPPPPPGSPAPPHAPRAPRAPRAWAWHGDPGELAFDMLPGGPRKLGIEYTEMGEQLAAYFKLPGKSGVLVTAVDADGPAARGGLKAGDAIVKLAGDTIEDAGDLREALADAEGGSEVAVTVQRDGRPIELKVTLAKPVERKRRSSSGVSL